MLFLVHKMLLPFLPWTAKTARSGAVKPGRPVKKKPPQSVALWLMGQKCACVSWCLFDASGWATGALPELLSRLDAIKVYVDLSIFVKKMALGLSWPDTHWRGLIALVIKGSQGALQAILFFSDWFFESGKLIACFSAKFLVLLFVFYLNHRKLSSSS